MLGYIISDKEEINVKEHEIFNFDILHKTNLNIFVVENNKRLYKNNIMYYACYFGHVEVLKWFKNSGYEFKYNKWSIDGAIFYGHVKILEWFNYNRHIKILEFFKNHNVKKVIKWSKLLKFLKTIKYKTKNNYIKGYNKN
jgi:hypothetical protein